MVLCEIKKANYENTLAMAAKLRPCDAREVFAASGMTGPEVVSRGVAASEESWIVEHDGEAFCVFGVVRLNDTIGIPWLLATKKIYDETCKNFILLRSKEWVEKIMGDYKVLINYVDARNKQAIRWLEWAGFKLEKPRPYGFKRLPFHKFTLKRSDLDV